MNMAQVLYVLAVAKHRNFSKAAEALFVSQPALSQQVRKLEMELGYDLFQRTPRGVFLTEDGQRFCMDAQPVADEWACLQQKVRRQTGGVYRHLRVGMGSRVYSNGLFDDVVRFFEMHPEIEVTFVTEAGQDFLTGMKDGALDLALDRLPPQKLLAGLGGFVSYDLIREQQCVLMSPDDPRKALDGISFSELRDCVMLTGLENSIEDRTLKEECREYGITPRRIYRSDSIDTIMSLVRKGKGVALGARSFAAYYGVEAVPLLPESDVYLRFICLEKNVQQPEIRLFLKYLQAVCRERGMLDSRDEKRSSSLSETG